MVRISCLLCAIVIVILFSGCATTTFHGVRISPTDCRDGNGVHVACRETAGIKGIDGKRLTLKDPLSGNA